MPRSGLLLAALLALLAPVRGEEGRRKRPPGVPPSPAGLGEGPPPAVRPGARGSPGGRGMGGGGAGGGGTEGERAPPFLCFYSFD